MIIAGTTSVFIGGLEYGMLAWSVVWDGTGTGMEQALCCEYLTGGG
jgi:hypothetical protein